MAGIKADEITKILKEQITNFESTVTTDEVGTVISGWSRDAFREAER